MADQTLSALRELTEAVMAEFFGNDTNLSKRLIAATNKAQLLLMVQPPPAATGSLSPDRPARRRKPGPPPTASITMIPATVLYRGYDHCNRLWTVTVDISHPKDPPNSTRVWFNAFMADGIRFHVDSTSFWIPGSGWRGPWTPTKPRAVPPAVREAVEAALRQQEVA